MSGRKRWCLPHTQYHGWLHNCANSIPFPTVKGYEDWRWKAAMARYFHEEPITAIGRVYE